MSGPLGGIFLTRTVDFGSKMMELLLSKVDLPRWFAVFLIPAKWRKGVNADLMPRLECTSSTVLKNAIPFSETPIRDHVTVKQINSCQLWVQL